MPRIQETSLPGVGLRHEFTTEAGEHIGVVTHRSGERDIVVYDPDDPDTVLHTVHLDEGESHVVAELLGGSQVTQNLSDMMSQSVAGLTIHWMRVRPTWWCADRTIAESMLRARTGVSIVAILRDDTTIPSPTPDVVMRADDTVVAVGTQEGLANARGHLRDGTR